MPVVITLCTSTKCCKPVIFFFPQFFRRTAGKEKHGCSALADWQTYVQLYVATEFEDREVFECMKPKCLLTITVVWDY